MTQTAASLANDTQSRIVDALNQSLSDTVVTTMLAQNFHWNVKGMAFGSLHALFQEIYEDHFAAQDDLAERIRALGGHADGNLGHAIARSKIAESDGHASDKEMIAMMQKAQETLAASVAEAARIAADAGDALSEDLCIARGQAHEKFAWMMRAHLA